MVVPNKAEEKLDIPDQPNQTLGFPDKPKFKIQPLNASASASQARETERVGCACFLPFSLIY